MSASEYAYEVDASGRIRSLVGGGAWQPTGAVRLDGVQRTASWLGPFAAPARDLLRIAAGALDADRLSPRRPVGLRGPASDLAWQRIIHLRIAVENPDRCQAAVPVLHGLLNFMTDDRWNISFESAAPPMLQHVLFPAYGEPTMEVALFSGGLDSVAGMHARALSRRVPFVAVSACGNDVRGKAQAIALECVQEGGFEARLVRLVHQLREAGRTRREMEPSRRSRGLLFLAMGAAVASELRVPTFSAYETGIGCINLPTSGAQVGSQGTRAMHPFTLSEANKLIECLLDQPVRVVVPFFLYTKAMLCREIGPRLSRLAAVTMSCDEGEGHKPDAMEHCGLCTSCIFRRVALLSAGDIADPTRYRDQATRRHGAYELRAFEHHAAELAGCVTFDDLVQLDPDIRFAHRAPLEIALPREEVEARVLTMYALYQKEIARFLDRARPQISPRPKSLGKEHSRDLFAAAG